MNLEREEAVAREVLLAMLARKPEIMSVAAILYVGYGDRLQRRVAWGLDFSIRDTPLRRATRGVLTREMEAMGWEFDPGGYDVWDLRLAVVRREETSAHEMIAASRRFAA